MISEHQKAWRCGQCVLFKPYLTDGVKCLQALGLMKTEADFIGEASLICGQQAKLRFI